MVIISTERSILFNFTECKLTTLILFLDCSLLQCSTRQMIRNKWYYLTIYTKETLIVGVFLRKEKTGNCFLSIGGRDLGQTRSFSGGSGQRDGWRCTWKVERTDEGRRFWFLRDAHFVISFFLVIVVGLFLAFRWGEQQRDTGTVVVCIDTGQLHCDGQGRKYISNAINARLFYNGLRSKHSFFLSVRASCFPSVPWFW